MPEPKPPSRPPAFKREFLPLIQQAKEIAKKHGISPELFLSLIQRESGGDPNAASGKGAVGLTQLLPTTAGEMGLDPYDVAQNLEGGAQYLAKMLKRFGGNEALATAAYNAGPGKVKGGKVPNIPETQGYVKAIQSAKPYYASDLLEKTEQARHTAYGEGNSNLFSRPISKNPDGSTSTLNSMGVGVDGQEYLIPGVDARGGGLLSPQDAFDQFRGTGRHLGKFSSPEASNAAGEALHHQAERGDYTVPLATSKTAPDPDRVGALMDFLVTGQRPRIPQNPSYIQKLLQHGEF